MEGGAIPEQMVLVFVRKQVKQAMKGQAYKVTFMPSFCFSPASRLLPRVPALALI